MSNTVDDHLNVSLIDVPFDQLGSLGQIAQFIYDTAPHPNRKIALLGALMFMATITGRSYVTWTGACLNLWLMLLAETGKGKEAATNGRSKLLRAVAKKIPGAEVLDGPNLVSAAGALNATERAGGSIVFNIPEAAYKIKAIVCRPSPNDAQTGSFMLDSFGKASVGSCLNPNGNADASKSIKKPISRPAISFFAESIPSTMYELLDERMIASGLLSRFVIVEVKDPRASLVDNPTLTPDEPLVADVANRIAIALDRNSRDIFEQVMPTVEARALFRRFSDYITQIMNEQSSNVVNELHNREWLNASKIACILAVSDNPYNPIVTERHAAWATNMVVDAVKLIIGKFERNEVGSVDGDEAKQRAAVLRIIAEYLSRDFASLAKYDVVEEMHKRGVITHSYLSRRLFTLPAFKDRLGPTAAIKRVVQRMLEDDELREMPAKQMVETFGSKPKAYVMSNMKPFLASL